MAGEVVAEVKSIFVWGEHAPDDMSLDSYMPPNPGHFGFHAQVFIGTTDDHLSDSFEMVVCSPSWFAAQSDERLNKMGYRIRGWPDEVTFGTGIWFMRRWDHGIFVQAVQAVCDGFGPGGDWSIVASRIGRVIPWEYDYRYDNFVDQHPGTAVADISDAIRSALRDKYG